RAGAMLGDIPRAHRQVMTRPEIARVGDPVRRVVTHFELRQRAGELAREILADHGSRFSRIHAPLAETSWRSRSPLARQVARRFVKETQTRRPQGMPRHAWGHA